MKEAPPRKRELFDKKEFVPYIWGQANQGDFITGDFDADVDGKAVPRLSRKA